MQDTTNEFGARSCTKCSDLGMYDDDTTSTSPCRPCPEDSSLDAKQPLVTTCLSEQGWVNVKGDYCSDFKRGAYCTKRGGYGPGWESSWQSFTDRKMAARDGTTALQACCACGGGKTWQVRDIKSCTCNEYYYDEDTSEAGVKCHFNGGCV